MKSVVGHSLVHFLAARTPRGSLGGPVGARKRDRAAHVASGAEFIRALLGITYVSNVFNMGFMFGDAEDFNQPLNCHVTLFL